MGRALTASSANLHFDEPSGEENDLLLKLVVEASPDLVYVYDRIEQRYLFVSDQVTAMLGYTPEQIQALKGDDLYQLVHLEDIDQMKADRVQNELLSDDEVAVTTYRVRHAFGDYRILRCRRKVLSRGDAGEVRCLLGVATDITQELRRQTELEALRTRVLQIRDEERRDIALRMHDTAMQHLVGAALLLNNIQLKFMVPEGNEMMDQVHASLSKALRDMLEPFTTS